MQWSFNSQSAVTRPEFSKWWTAATYLSQTQFIAHFSFGVPKNAEWSTKDLPECTLQFAVKQKVMQQWIEKWEPNEMIAFLFVGWIRFVCSTDSVWNLDGGKKKTNFYESKCHH